MYLNQIRIIRIFIVLIFGIGLCFPQSLEDLKRLREAYEENKKAQDAKSIIKDWENNQVKKKQEECKRWWSSYKINLQEMVKNKITK